jgi:pilus assembly protein TadC
VTALTAFTTIAAMLAAALAGRTRTPAKHRLTAMWHRPDGFGGDAASRPRTPRQRGIAAPDPHQCTRPLPAPRVVAAAGIVVAGTVMVGGAAGVVVGVVGAAVAVRIRPRVTLPRVDPDEVPVVVDLLAGCLAAGAGMPAALDAAAVAGGDVLRDGCHQVAAALRMGIPATEAWAGWLADPWLAPVARTAERTAQSGAAVAEDLRRTSARLRARRRTAAQHRVRQASVWLVVPLGLCFLPAFVLVAVVPLVVGLLPSLR